MQSQIEEMQDMGLARHTSGETIFMVTTSVRKSRHIYPKGANILGCRTHAAPQEQHFA